MKLLRFALHLLAHGARQILIVSREQLHRLLHARGVLRLVRHAAAEPVAAAHVVVEAGALPADVAGEFPRAGRQAEGRADRVDRRARFVAPAEGAEIARAVGRRAVDERKPRVRPPAQAHEGIALVVLEQDVVVRHVLLDERVFQDQRLELTGDEDRVEMVHLRDHAPRLLVVGGVIFLEILADAVLELLRLAHVDDLSGPVHHQIDAGASGSSFALARSSSFVIVFASFRSQEKSGLVSARNRLFS